MLFLFVLIVTMHYTYILYSEKLGLFYKGSTNDVSLRLKRHNGGLENYTSKGVPWILLWFIEKPSKSEAQKLEYKLKNLSQIRLIEFMLKYQDGVVGPDELLFIKQLSGC